ncbi:sperm microtubule associated protein 2 isoform X2 [Paroedura picta]|uniref:sperm microtubule associated protein 2 isoform X2 n=1 Tax=Paroedura picta TaxID=143630 RepID=UPI004055EBE6
MGLDYINKLAQPKVCHQVVFNRPTVYWVDKIPSAHHKFTTPDLTPRQEELSQAKKVDPAFKEDRSSSEWRVTRAAMKAKASPRLKELAEPRPCADGWEFSRPLYSVSKGAMAAIPSERINLLAKPKELPATLPRSSKVNNGCGI